MAKRKDRGATMVEFAMVVVFLFLLIFIIVEGAFAVRARNTMSNALDDAARRGAVAATSPDADFQILSQLIGREAHIVADIEYVSIFLTTGADDPGLPAGCEAPPGVKDVCNTYSGLQLFDPGTGAFNKNASDFDCSGGLGFQWCPSTRGLNTTGALEFIGVYVQADYKSIMPALGERAYNSNVTGFSRQAIESSGETTDSP